MNLFTEIQIQNANELLHLINDELKEKEKYKPLYVFTQGNYEVYVCGRMIEKDKYDILFNVLDFEGKTPSGLSANWRNYEHIKKELNINH